MNNLIIKIQYPLSENIIDKARKPGCPNHRISEAPYLLSGPRIAQYRLPISINSKSSNNRRRILQHSNKIRGLSIERFNAFGTITEAGAEDCESVETKWRAVRDICKRKRESARMCMFIKAILFPRFRGIRIHLALSARRGHPY